MFVIYYWRPVVGPTWHLPMSPHFMVVVVTHLTINICNRSVR